MTDFATIYAHHAEDYDRLVAREDYQGNLLRAIRQIRPLQGARVAEPGAGTGRVTRLIAPWARHVVASDRSAHMLSVARRRLADLQIDNATLIVADNAALPLRTASTDLAIAGWSFGHTTQWEPERWRDRIGQAIDEMRRVLKPGGTSIVIETLGTGSEKPQPPNQHLADYYAWLERDRGFHRTWIRTDYRFASGGEANELTGFFFGSAALYQLLPDGRAIVPECTGLWWR
jgi:ubiquinone/menaquinone biosynthesis C-methylase UbiE